MSRAWDLFILRLGTVPLWGPGHALSTPGCSPTPTPAVSGLGCPRARLPRLLSSSLHLFGPSGHILHRPRDRGDLARNLPCGRLRLPSREPSGNNCLAWGPGPVFWAPCFRGNPEDWGFGLTLGLLLTGLTYWLPSWDKLLLWAWSFLGTCLGWKDSPECTLCFSGPGPGLGVGDRIFTS